MPLTFESWMPNRPNVKEHNQDDCALMDCKKHDCDWLDVSCTDDVNDHNRHNVYNLQCARCAAYLPHGLPERCDAGLVASPACTRSNNVIKNSFGRC